MSLFCRVRWLRFPKRAYVRHLICKLETHAPLALLPDRFPETITAWLQQHPFIKIVSRDGFTGFKQGITDSNPSIKQVYDRWHFITNAKNSWIKPYPLSFQLPLLGLQEKE
ncbi:transposase [Niallia sp. 03133]|uniref:transposase n=1 Tax=Niallia sp. 03133 TaxID=3458060 RepID=UPI004044DC87